MAITYDWFENPKDIKLKDPGVHPRPVDNGRVSMKELCSHAHQWCGLNRGTVMGVLDNIVRLCAEELCEGREVHIEGLGYFAPTLETSEPVKRSTKYKYTKVQLKGVSFRPDERLKKELSGAEFKQTSDPRPTESLTTTEVDMQLRKHFEENSTLTRFELERMCGMTRSTAYRHLHRLVEEGRLKKYGRHNQPIYMPAPGYFGRPLETKE